MDDSDAVAKLASANAALRTAEATLHDMEQGGSQEERITLSGDLSRAQIQQQQAPEGPRRSPAAPAGRSLRQRGRRRGRTSTDGQQLPPEPPERAPPSVTVQPTRPASRHRSPTPAPPSKPPRAPTTPTTSAHLRPAPSTPSPSPPTTSSPPAKTSSTSPTSTGSRFTPTSTNPRSASSPSVRPSRSPGTPSQPRPGTATSPSHPPPSSPTAPATSASASSPSTTPAATCCPTPTSSSPSPAAQRFKRSASPARPSTPKAATSSTAIVNDKLVRTPVQVGVRQSHSRRDHRRPLRKGHRRPATLSTTVNSPTACRSKSSTNYVLLRRLRSTFRVLLSLCSCSSALGSLLADTARPTRLLQQGRVDEAASQSPPDSRRPTRRRPRPSASLPHLLRPGDRRQRHPRVRTRRRQRTLQQRQPDVARPRLRITRPRTPIPSLPSVSPSRFASPSKSAVQLDPENIHAMSDLGEYYVAAPSLIGGGLDKAQALAARMQPQFPAQSHRLLALIAEKKKRRSARRDRVPQRSRSRQRHPKPGSISATSISATISLTR